MKSWTVLYWQDGSKPSPIEQWMNNLTKDHLIAVAKEVRLLEIAGNALRMPHSKALGSGLFELRERRYGFRIYYTYREEKIVILLAAGNKKSQAKDIIIARERLG